MPYSGKKATLGRTKGYLNVAGPQFRFILFLLAVLIVYTLLLQVFRKLAEFVHFPVFFPIALVSLLVFIGIIGATYSHTIVGPLLRIRNALRGLAEGDPNVALRLRESDDPLLKEIVREIALLSEHSRNMQAALDGATKDFLKEATLLEETVRQGAAKAELDKHVEALRKKHAQMEAALKTLAKNA